MDKQKDEAGSQGGRMSGTGGAVVREPNLTGA